MKLPFSIPTETFYGTLTFLGLAAVVYSVSIPTSQFDEYKKRVRDTEEEERVLAVEQEYLNKIQQFWSERTDKGPEVYIQLLEQEKALSIRRAKLDIQTHRTNDRYKAWHKSRLWSRLVGIGGIVTTIIGFYLWRQSERRRSRTTDSK